MTYFPLKRHSSLPEAEQEVESILGTLIPYHLRIFYDASTKGF